MHHNNQDGDGIIYYKSELEAMYQGLKPLGQRVENTASLTPAYWMELIDHWSQNPPTHNAQETWFVVSIILKYGKNTNLKKMDDLPNFTPSPMTTPLKRTYNHWIGKLRR